MALEITLPHTIHHQRHTYCSLGSFTGDLQRINGHKYFIRRVRTQKIKGKLIFHGHIMHRASKVHHLGSWKNMDPGKSRDTKKKS